MSVNKHHTFRRKNIIQKEAEEILKYKNLTIEIQCMWNIKEKVIPATIGVK